LKVACGWLPATADTTPAFICAPEGFAVFAFEAFMAGRAAFAEMFKSCPLRNAQRRSRACGAFGQ
jgi:hypothetical protein